MLMNENLVALIGLVRFKLTCVCVNASLLRNSIDRIRRLVWSGSVAMAAAGALLYPTGSHSSRENRESSLV